MSDQIERQCPDCTDTVCCICQGINESCLDMPSHPGPSRDKKRIKELEAEIARLTDSEDSRRPERGKRPSMYNDRLAELVAENKRLRAECVEYDEANTDLGIALAEARAELDRTKPVVDAAEEWYAAFEYEELDENYSAEERVLFNTIKANPSCPSCGPGGCAGHTRKPSEVDRKLPVCAECGHRHRWGGECADHSWTDSCPYDANGDCEGVVCPRCGGRDGTHTVRACGEEELMRARAAYPVGSQILYWPGIREGEGRPGYTIAEVSRQHGNGILWVRIAKTSGGSDFIAMTHVQLATEGLSSTDTTAVERG